MEALKETSISLHIEQVLSIRVDKRIIDGIKYYI